ncbi:UDP-N-acetylmuramate dehydrogenase [Thiospirochaeta perfilievii]|uniref:UDP-N-acetylenolpyruvoylglucosamine reductase n=1 Tax=Thiospirochaeta perfilievii TaxID=252967 RepID=A0A5C1QAA1_9SPIO|nr:UDP-N-acetylmuramate dehydrogenase [Thiospirochaeta perfilievii]QEN03584.1 UDP-N-acetylmuramate dehydrogenase [Thiospirochaeta perfilievii]
MNRILDIVNKINITGTVTSNENMAKHTTFKCGGKAEIFIEAGNPQDIVEIKKVSKENDIPLFILGGGANILVSDLGIPGITLSLNRLDSVEFLDNCVIAESGISVNNLCSLALNRSLSGLEFINGMPGTIGGAVWMNARCYGDEISNIFLWAEYIDQDGNLQKIHKNSSHWDYKISPFQNNDSIITRIALQLKPGTKESIKDIMDKNSRDRRDKGHFKYPCAGSVFKNNREFGFPSGKIIEDAGLKGQIKGGAQISTFHGNIIVNLGDATASDINYLIDKTIDVVKNKTGYILEPEVLKVGIWE